MKIENLLKVTPRNPSDYVVDELVPSNRLVFWASPPGHGKSLAGTFLMYSVAYGAPCLGNEVNPGNVMFIDSENRLDVLQTRSMKIMKGLERNGYKKQCEVDFQSYTGFLLDDRATWQKIETEIKALKPSLIMIDHLAMFHKQNEDKSTPMTKVATAIEELMDISGSSILVMHHFNKYDTGNFIIRLRGSTAIYAKSDVACEIRSLSTRSGMQEKIGIIFQPRKDITPGAFRMRVEEGMNWIHIVRDGNYKPIDNPQMDEMAHKFYHAFIDIKEDTSDGITVNQMKKNVEGFASDSDIRECLQLMERSKGLITSERKGKGGGFHYELAPTNSKFKECPWCGQKSIL